MKTKTLIGLIFSLIVVCAALTGCNGFYSPPSSTTPATTTPVTTTLSSTATVCGSWAAYAQLEASLFSGAKAGDVIKITTSDLLSGAQGSLKDATGWAALASGLDYFDISGDYTHTLTAETLSIVQAKGLVVGGQNYTITGVYLVSQ